MVLLLLVVVVGKVRERERGVKEESRENRRCRVAEEPRRGHHAR